MNLHFLFALSLIAACHTTGPKVPSDDHDLSSSQDSARAASWGADPYGMKQYVLVLLKAGPNRSQDSLTRANLQKAHMENITRLANEGKLILAGPMMDEGEIRGIYVFDVRSLEEARALTETDPAIQAGSLVLEMHPWYCTAALMDLPRLHKLIAKKDI